MQRGVIKWEQLIEIGEILAGKKKGAPKLSRSRFTRTTPAKE